MLENAVENKDNLSSEGKLNYINEKPVLNNQYYTDSDIIKINKLLEKLGTTAIIINRLDYYGNSIPIAAIGNAMSFILYGFYRCKVYSNNDTFLWAVILFGGILQITGGLMEFIKGRSFTTMLYLVLGFYCLTYYVSNMIPMELGRFYVYGLYNTNLSLAFFYGSWMAIFIPVFVCSFKTNLFFLMQSIFTLAFLIIRCIGELFNVYSLQRHTSGIIQVIAGFCSLYICLNQLINEQFRKPFLPSFPLTLDNEIDIMAETPQ